MTRSWRLRALAVCALVGALVAMVVYRSPRAEAARAAPSAERVVQQAAALPAQPLEHTEHRTVAVTLPDSTAAQLGAAFAARLGRANAVGKLIADARSGALDPVDFGRRLQEATRGRPELGSELLGALETERSPPVALKLAQALARLEDDPRLREETIASLRASSSDVRAVGLLALLGRGDAEAAQLFGDTLASGTPEARATAAFVLNNTPDALSGAVEQQALAAARSALQDPAAGARLREESATLLGRPGASSSDVTLLETTVFEASPAVSARALAALEGTGAEPSALRATFDAVLREPSASDQLRAMAQAWLAANP